MEFSSRVNTTALSQGFGISVPGDRGDCCQVDAEFAQAVSGGFRVASSGLADRLADLGQEQVADTTENQMPFERDNLQKNRSPQIVSPNRPNFGQSVRKNENSIRLPARIRR